MIITLIFVAIFLTGIGILIYAEKSRRYHIPEILEMSGCLSSIIGGIAVFICVLIIIAAHTGVSVKIEQDNIKYESYKKQLEMINSDYEDISKTEVVNNIANWNSATVNSKYWANNPWTNWFYSKTRIDALQTIEY